MTASKEKALREELAVAKNWAQRLYRALCQTPNFGIADAHAKDSYTLMAQYDRYKRPSP